MHTARNDRPNVVFVLRTLTTYRIPFLTRLSAAAPDWNITVLAGEGVVEAGKLESAPAELPFGVRKIPGHAYEVWKYTLVWLGGCIPALRDLNCDVVILEGNFGILSQTLVAAWARITGRRVIYWIAGWDKPKMIGFAAQVRARIIRTLLPLAHYSVCYSTRAADNITRLGALRGTVVVAQNTIDIEQIIARRDQTRAAAAAARQRLGIDRQVVLVSVGAITRDKHPERLVELHQELRARHIDVHTVIVGDGPAMPALRATVHSAATKGIHLVGRVVDEADAYFAIGDVFVLPSIGGLAINQAMANGLPVVCGMADGTEQDLVEDGVNGYRRAEYNCGEWAGLIEGILKDAPRRAEMGQASLDRVQRVASLGNMCGCFDATIRLSLATRP